MRKEKYHFDRHAADRVEEFFATYLTHVKGEWAGKPLELRPWQREKIIRPLFGWKRSDGTRKYRTCFCFVPRKNGKSTLAAGIALYMLLAYSEPGAEVYGAAKTRGQAKIVWKLAKKMAAQNEAIARRTKAYTNSIVAHETGGMYQAVSADAGTQHGLNPSGIIFDELHTQKNRELYDTLTTALGARSQPLTFLMTTAGQGTLGIARELYDHAKKILGGVYEDPEFLPVIYEAGKDDPIHLVRTWKKANPNLDHSPKRSFLRSELRGARQMPAQESRFRRLYLNQWVEASDPWVKMSVWDKCDGAVSEKKLEGRVCYGGLDLASVDDVAALVLDFPHEDGEGHDWLCRFWVPKSTAKERQDRTGIPYLTWIKQGYMVGTEGEVIDFDVIEAEVKALSERYEIREIAYDRWGMEHMRQQLEKAGLTMISMGQGFASMTSPTKELQRMILGSTLHHGGHPVLRWMVSNAVAETDAAANIKLSKSKSQEKIDGVIAGVMAVDRATRSRDDEESGSVYNQRGLISV